jgi:type II secretory pathway pseudopilin PulG
MTNYELRITNKRRLPFFSFLGSEVRKSIFLLRSLYVANKKSKKNNGYILVSTLVFATIAIIILTGLATWAATNYRAVSQTAERERAFQIAEAGVDYYRWHLAHAPQDFQDGTGQNGPYAHPYYDKLGNLVGQYELSITPPLVGSTVVKIVSKGTVASTTVSRSIEAILAIPSLAKYAFVANSVMRFGEGTEIFGPIHSNDGIRMDGLAHNLVTSAKASYNDPDNSGDDEFGAHTHKQAPPSSAISEGGLSSEEPPAPVPVRTDVFVTGRQFPVPAVDFNGLTQNLANLKTLAQASNRYFASSGAQGYNLVLKTDGSFDLYKVTALVSAPNSCNKPNWDDQAGWSTWSVKTQEFIANYTFPTNGVIFMEDNVWVEGKIDNARVTIASGKFPESVTTNTSISFTKDILYTNYDGQDVIALIAQNNINAGMESADTIEIDAALIAKNGRVGRYYYNSSCHPYDERTKIRLYGMIGTNQRYGFAYASTNGRGYETREIVYDGNLLYGPPPSFPLTSDQYVTISWREI